MEKRKIPKMSEKMRNEMISKCEIARIAYEDLSDQLEERARNFRYRTGDQWSERVKDPDNKRQYIKEETLIRRQGRLPAKQNLIGKTIRNLKGQFRTNVSEPIVEATTRESVDAKEMMNAALKYALYINEAEELDAYNMEEYTMSAVVGWKIMFGVNHELNREEIEIKNIEIPRFFYNVDSSDIRGKDITVCGELHDMTIEEVMEKFDFSWRDKEKVMRLFPDASARMDETYKFPSYVDNYKNFYIADNPDKVRVIELWQKEYNEKTFMKDEKYGSYHPVSQEWFIENDGVDPAYFEEHDIHDYVNVINQLREQAALDAGVSVPVRRRYLYDDVAAEWNVYFLTSNGDLLFSDTTPYQHGEHPYVFGRYMVDGKLIPLISSFVDQQRHVNRLISFIDASLGRSLKDVLMIDTDSIPAQYKQNFQEYADEMVKIGNMFFYTSHDGRANIPKVIQSNSVPADAYNLLQLQSELIKDLSAVNDAIQGNQPQAGTPASLYAQQTINASITNKDLFDFYYNLINKRNRKVVKVIKQFYQEPRYIKIAGMGNSRTVESSYNPDVVSSIDFDTRIGDSQNNLSFKLAVDNELKEFLAAQLITFEEFLETSNKPYAETLLSVLESRKEDQRNAGIPPDAISGVEQIPGTQISPGANQGDQQAPNINTQSFG